MAKNNIGPNEMAEKKQLDPDEMSPEAKDIFDQIIEQVLELEGCKYDRETGVITCDVTEEQAQIISAKPAREIRFKIVKSTIVEMDAAGQRFN